VFAVLALGPQLMHLAFGKKFDYDRIGLLIVTAGMGLYLSAVTINQACLAQGQGRRASLRWIGCAVFFVAWCLVAAYAVNSLAIPPAWTSVWICVDPNGHPRHGGTRACGAPRAQSRIMRPQASSRY